MFRHFISFATIAAASFIINESAAQQLSFQGLQVAPVSVVPPATTGLNEVFVLPYTEGATAIFTAAEPGQTISWQRFSSLGGGYAEPVASTQNGLESTLQKLEGDMGYIITAGSKSYYYWVTDYSNHRLWFADLNLNAAESDCSTSWLDVDGQGPRITYYSITGVPQTLSRELQLTYTTLAYDEAATNYMPSQQTITLESFDVMIHCQAPLCQTDYTLSGDRFLRAWGEEQTITSPVYDPVAVEARTSATQTARDVDNEQKVEATLGGSGPCEITFSSAVTDAAIFHQWEIASDPDFNMVTLRFNELEFSHTFRLQGTSYIRLVCANETGDCEFFGETYTVFIGESDIKCPNAFSPGSSEGVNDEWKVSYKSIISFECHIFNRWGQQMAHLTDPSQGWDGKSNGKTVPAGVYFYVIRAEGADGKQYKLSGDINVVKLNKQSKGHNTTN